MSTASYLARAVALDGEALLLDSGRPPCVITATGDIDLSAEPLTGPSIDAILTDLLSAADREALDRVEAWTCELPPVPELPGERFTLVAIRSGADWCVELRRNARLLGAPDTSAALPDEDPSAPHEATALQPAGTMTAVGKRLGHFFTAWRNPKPGEEDRDNYPPQASVELPPAQTGNPENPLSLDHLWSGQEFGMPETAGPESQLVDLGREFIPDEWDSTCLQPPAGDTGLHMPAEQDLWPSRTVVEGRPEPVGAEAGVREPESTALVKLMWQAASRQASTVYLMTGTPARIRVDQEIEFLDDHELSASAVESLIIGALPEGERESFRNRQRVTWISTIESIGPIHCSGFHDRRGPAARFRLPRKARSIDDLDLAPDIQAFVLEREGLLLVAGHTFAARTELVGGLVDLMNRTRRDYIITIESELHGIYEPREAILSQREALGTGARTLAAARAALTDSPDVLVIEDLRGGALLRLALETAGQGHLVVGGLHARTSADAIARIVRTDMPRRNYEPARLLADNLCAVITQVELRRRGGGRVYAREVLLNTPDVSSLIAERQLARLPHAIETGRDAGMVPLNDALVDYVRQGVVDLEEAYRQAGDRATFLAALDRMGIDASTLRRS